jgi:hypothetical protein
MASTDLQRALLEAESEWGEQAILKESNGTFTVNDAQRRQRACGWNSGVGDQNSRHSDPSGY